MYSTWTKNKRFIQYWSKNLHRRLIYSAFTSHWSIQRLQVIDLFSVYKSLIYSAFTSRWPVRLAYLKSPRFHVCCVFPDPLVRCTSEKRPIFALLPCFCGVALQQITGNSQSKPPPNHHRTTTEPPPNHHRTTTEKSNATASRPPTLADRNESNTIQQHSKVSQINNDVARYARSFTVCTATLPWR